MSLLLSSPAKVETYTFTKIADNSGDFDYFLFPVINNEGTVAFRGFPKAGGTSIVTGSGGPTTTIVDTSGPFSFFNNPSINNLGTVAFGAGLDTGGRGIFTNDESTTTTIVDTSGPFSFLPSFSVSLNDSGTVAFFAGLDAGGDGIFTGDGTTTTIFNNSGPLDFSSGFQITYPAINNEGTVAFAADIDAGGRGIFTSDGKTTTTIADTSGSFGSFGVLEDTIVSLNDQETVAFQATLDTRDQGIFTGIGEPTTTIADTSGSFVSLSDPAINNKGTVAFSASFDENGVGAGIFTGSDPVADKVIASGDSLFGSTVTSIDFPTREGLNDVGQLTFIATLANGTEVVVRADPVVAVPEPSGVNGLFFAIPIIYTLNYCWRRLPRKQRD